MPSRTPHRAEPDSREFVQAVADTVPDGFVEQDARLTITGWNSGAEQLFGWHAGDVVGRCTDILVPERNRDRYKQSFHQIHSARPAGPVTHRITCLHRDGREFKAEVTLSLTERHGETYLLTYVRDCTERHDVELRLQETEQTLREVLDSLEDGYFEVDLKGTFTAVNAAYCAILGVSAEDLLGHNYRDLFQDEERSRSAYEAFSQVYTTRRSLKGFEYSVTRHDGARRFLEHSIALRTDAKGHPSGFLCIARDCTERKVAEQQLAAARDEAEGASQAKSEFLANMSHEIRTPMNGIIGMTQLVLGTTLTPYQKECLDTLRSSAESLLTILNDILDFSKIESRKLEIERRPFSIEAVVRDTVRLMQPAAHGKALGLVVEMSDLPPHVMGDALRLRQVVTNLVGNAIKFTGHGSVCVAVRHAAFGDNQTIVTLSVSDTGIGIPADKHQKIFEAFSQADGSTTRRFGGTGLGLAISSALVHMMGGMMSVTSEPGQGSTFEVRLPLEIARPSAAGTAMPSRRRAEAPALRRAHSILLAEDNTVNQRVAVGLLTRRGHRVDVAANGREAIAALESRDYDLVLMDLQMPEMGGLEATEAIRAAEKQSGRHIRIVAMTAHAMMGDRDRCLAAGMDGYLAKPIDPAALFNCVEAGD